MSAKASPLEGYVRPSRFHNLVHGKEVAYWDALTTCTRFPTERVHRLRSSEALRFEAWKHSSLRHSFGGTAQTYAETAHIYAWQPGISSWSIPKGAVYVRMGLYCQYTVTSHLC
jgi:hypothetical protein